MGKIYVGQYFKITLTLSEDVTGWTNIKVRAKKPNGIVTDFESTTLDIPTGKIQAQIQATDNTKGGQWTVWAIGTTSDSKPAIGESSTFIVYNEGN